MLEIFLQYLVCSIRLAFEIGNCCLYPLLPPWDCFYPLQPCPFLGRIAVSGFEISHERERSVQANCKLETELTRQSHHSKQNIPLVMVVKRVLKAAKAVGERIFFVSAFLN
mmetsp:Transcript_21206/g.31410  ORF Transcript_21206/g.31410 Transcript_21206/m.31410 type:complete len:111 (+) Transcript_21206:179-511(+)